MDKCQLRLLLQSRIQANVVKSADKLIEKDTINLNEDQSPLASRGDSIISSSSSAKKVQTKV